MKLASQPDFDRLQKLSQGQDADLTYRALLSEQHVRGRGAQSRHRGRFERYHVEQNGDVFDEEEFSRAKTHVQEERVKSLITRNQSPDLPFDVSINPYRGCAHGCSYCYARPTHTYLGHSAGLDFETALYAKINAPEILQRELAAPKYKPKWICLGANTDPYQPIERQFGLTRKILEVLEATNHPVAITTKSALVVRDLDILSRMAAKGLASVSISMTSMDHILARKMEPQASSPQKRLEAMRLLKEAGIPIHVMASPMIPAINDMELERILDAAAAQGATSASMILLRLPSEVYDIFREWLLRHYPNKVEHVMSLVRQTRNGKGNDARFHTRFVGEGAYATILGQRFALARKRFGLRESGPALLTHLFEPPNIDSPQMELF